MPFNFCHILGTHFAQLHFFNPPSSISAASEWPYPHAYTGSIKEILK